MVTGGEGGDVERRWSWAGLGWAAGARVKREVVGATGATAQLLPMLYTCCGLRAECCR